MRDSVTMHMGAEPERVWELVSDITAIGRFSPETFEAEWQGGATGPALGARFRGHVRRNERGPVYWTQCLVTDCEPGRAFGFTVGVGARVINNWHYRTDPAPGGGTDVTESFRLEDDWANRLYWLAFGRWRGPRNRADMRRTLERVKAVAEAGDSPT